jgi:polyisoprenoid-binding protein YceI
MTVRYTLDPAQSRFTVQAFAAGMLSAFAHNPVVTIRDFAGQMDFDPEKPQEASLEMTVKAASLEVTGSVNERDRPEIERTMRQEVLETAAYPEITFRGTALSAARVAEGWYRLQLEGEVCLHGATNRQGIDAQVRLFEDGLRLGGEFKLLQSAYRIKRVSAVAGTITLKDELKFSFDLFGRKVG